jgi:hypothetical protein
MSKTRYFVTDGRSVVRYFKSEPDAFLFYTYHGCKGMMQKIHSETGIIIDQVVKLYAGYYWRSGRPINLGSDPAMITTINNYLSGRSGQFSAVTIESTILVERSAYGSPIQEQARPVDVTPTTTAPGAKSDAVTEKPTDHTTAKVTSAADTTTPHAPTATSEELAELERLRNYVKMHVAITEDEVRKRHEELEREWRAADAERARLERERQKRERAIEREAEERRKFEAGKTTYRMIRREVIEGKTKIGDIPSMFKHSYEAYKRLDDMGVLDLPDDPRSNRMSEWDQFQDIVEEIKEEEFERDRDRYVVIRDSINDGRMEESEIEPMFMPKYNTFSVLDQSGELNATCAYELFVDLLSTYMQETNQSKWGFDKDISYMSDVVTDPRAHQASEQEEKQASGAAEEESKERILTAEEAHEKYGAVGGTAAILAADMPKFASFLESLPEDD